MNNKEIKEFFNSIQKRERVDKKVKLFSLEDLLMLKEIIQKIAMYLKWMWKWSINWEIKCSRSWY